MKIKKNIKAQGSTEYILMLVGVIIVAIVILVFLFKTGGTASKNNGLQPELIAAEFIPKTKSVAIATNIQLPTISATGSGTVYINGNNKDKGTLHMTPVYQVSGGYEYNILGLPPISSITSITYTDSAGNNVTVLPASGAPITVVPGSFPFAITQIT